MRNLFRSMACCIALVISALAPLAHAQQPITLHGAVQFADDHPFNKALLQVRGAGQEVLRQADQLRAAPQQRARHREGLFRLHEPGHVGRLRASCRPRTCRRSPRRRRCSTCRSCSATSTTGTRCSTPTRSSRSSTTCRRRPTCMIIGYAGGGMRNIIANKPIRNMAELRGLHDARDGCADPDPDVPGDRRQAVGDRLQRGLQRHPDRRDPGRRERGRRARTR